MFYNTTNEPTETVIIKRRKNDSQEAEIMELFKKYYRLSPGIIHARNLMKKQPPIGSIRRALTDLTKSGHLTKTGIKTPGLYGDDEHVWEIVSKQGKLDF